MRLLAVSLLAVAASALVAVDPASASDRSVKQAWDAHDAKIERLAARREVLYRRWERSGYRRHRPLVRLLRAVRSTLADNIAGVRAEEPSSEIGRRAKRAAIRSVVVLDRAVAGEVRAVRADSAGRHRRAARIWRRVNRLLERAEQHARQGRRLFRRALAGGA